MPSWYTFLEDNNGGFSMMRGCLAVVVLAVMLNWSWINYKKTEIQPIPDNAVSLIAALAGAKVVQRFGEKGETDVNIDPTNGQPTITPNGASVGSMPLTVTVQGSVPVSGMVPIQQLTGQSTPVITPAPTTVPPVTPPAPTTTTTTTVVTSTPPATPPPVVTPSGPVVAMP